MMAVVLKREWRPVNDHDLPVLGADAVTTPESADGVHAVRPSNFTDALASSASPVMEPWEAAWKRSLYIQRALRDRRYCEQIRDAKAAGERPKTEDEFYAKPESILEL